ncbi:molecular chaperone DnaJ [Platysternon megacephalum]|uniref:Molecular chaperone DnaJ n=1 Tax=Platysternon megacephalum TaxID=55544 RepID=A0A4D9DHN5_9SAUR|nr:molecular chaperone DnaJ [Platysternon megacephalum]
MCVNLLPKGIRAEAAVTKLKLQASQVEQQLRSLHAKTAAAETEAKELQESQAAIWQLLKEAQKVKEGPINHSACQRQIEQLQGQLELSRGLVNATESNPLAAFTSTTSDGSDLNCNPPPEYSEGGGKKPSAPYEQGEQDSLPYAPLAPIVTTVTRYDGQGPPVIKHESKALTPEQTRAMGKQMGPCNKYTVLNWLAKISITPNLTQEDMVSLLRECMPIDDFSLLPYDAITEVQDNPANLYLSVLKVYCPYENVIGKAFSERQAWMKGLKGIS